MEKITRFFMKYKKTWVFSLSFLLPAFILLFVYKQYGFYPFGDKTLLVMDLNTQYIDFMIYLKRAITEGNGIIYSWAKGGGGPLIDLFAYYLASPLNIFLLFFSVEKMYNAVFFLNILKVGLIGVSFSLYLSYIHKKVNGYYVVFALCYALSTYVVAYSMSLMWLDALIMLPVILIGTEKILKEKKCLLFIVSYTLMLFSNFYTCFMITIFVVIYFIYRYIVLKEKDFVSKALLLAFGGLSSFLMSLWMLLPSIENMVYGKFQKGVLVSSSFFTKSADSFIKQIFPAQCSTITYNGGPNIFCGVLCALLVILYFINNRFSKKERVVSFLVILCFVVSFYINKIDVIWHMFQTPTWFPCRYAFLFCFFVMFLAYKSFSRLKSTKLFKIYASCFILLTVYAVVYILLKDKIVNIKGAYLGAGLALVYTLVLVLFRSRLKTVAVCLFVLIISFELSVNSLFTVKNLDRIFGYKEKTEFEEFIKTVSDDVDSLKNEDDDFYRIEKDFCRTENDSMSQMYNGIAHYSSSYNGAYNKAMKRMGLEQSFIILDSSGITPVFNTLFDVKYYFSKNPDFYGFYNEKSVNDNYSVLENPYTLPIGYLADEEVLNLEGFTSDYIKNQNLLTKALSSFECFEAIEYKKTAKNKYQFKVENNYPVYFTIPKKQNGIKDIKVNGKSIKMGEYTESCVFPLGEFQKDDEITVTLKKETEYFNSYFLNTDILKEMYNKLSGGGLEVTDYSSTSLEGKINAKENGVVFTTINYDKNWRIKIDGKEIKPKVAMDAFIGFDVEKGEHTISFKYVQTSFYTGVLISCLTFITLCILFVLKKKKKI